MSEPRLRAATLVAYGAPAIALAMLLLPPYVFLPAFYTQTLGLSLGGVGAVIILSRVFDAVIDPLIGHLSDRTPGRWGRRKPWIAAGTPLAIVAVIALFVPPAEPSLIYFALALFALTLAWTMLVLPYNAWGAELSGDYHERTRIAGTREGIGLCGTLIAAATPSLLSAAGHNDPREHMAALAIAIVVLIVPTIVWALVAVPEPEPLTRERVAWRDGLRAIAANAPFRRLIAAYLINAVANGLPATLFLLFVSHVIGAPDAYGPLLLAYFLAGLIGIPVWWRLAKHLGKHRAWVAASALTSIAFAATPFVVGQGDIMAFAIICAISGIGLGADLVLPAAIQADVVDADTQVSGEQRTGLFFALWGMATKLAFALAAISFPVLAWFGFRADALDAAGHSTNSAQALLVLTLFYAVVPIGLKAIAMTLMWDFPLDSQRQAETRSKILQH
jgi:Na+/melibiose symporter-like transporter